MPYVYSDPSREEDKWSLPNVEIFELTAEEAFELDENTVSMYLRKFPRATMSSRERDRMIQTAIDAGDCCGGWFWQACFPGCLPDSEPIGPFDTYSDALADAREVAGEDSE